MNNLVKQLVESRFNFNIDVDNELDVENKSLSKSQQNIISQIDSYEQHNLFVDLGLPSRTLWAKYNLGVDFEKYQMDLIPNWFGNYYAWGEIEPKEDYRWETYKFNRGQNKVGMSLIKYCNSTTYGFGDKHTVLEDQDNVVKQKFDKRCDLPTEKQVIELCNNTSIDWTGDYLGIEGLSGNIVRSDINGSELFFPDTGHYQGDSVDLHDGPELWTKDFIENDNQAIYMCIGTSIDTLRGYRYLGMPIRPILNKNQ